MTTPAIPNTTFDFSGRTVIVTGAARGVGEAMVGSFLASGASVIAVDRDAEALSASTVASSAIAIAADVAVTEDVKRVVATAVDQTGRVDVLVNNAGILRDTVLWKLSDEDWDAVLGVHLGGTFRFTRACVPQFRAQQYGRVINVTSYTGLHGNRGQAAYAAAKAGIIGFTKTAAKELAPFGVTVNAISPNAETRMIESLSEAGRTALTSLIPLGRFAPPEEIVSAVAFLGSAEAGYITGVVLPVDGGMSM
jgi:3-oxoacyl-[acyl-carrier protein] reductase